MVEHRASKLKTSTGLCPNVNTTRNKYTYRRSGAEYLSEPDLTTADKKTWDSGFPPGFTVDELRHYRRKRAPGHLRPKDHLHLIEGNFDQLKTEYKRRYKDYYLTGSDGDLKYDSKEISPVRANKPDDTFKLDGPDDIQSEYSESFIEHSGEQGSHRRRKRSAFQLVDDIDMALYDESIRSHPFVNTEVQSQFVKYEHADRRLPIRRSTNLKLEGDFLSTTEKAEQFIEYILNQRRGLIRNATHLKLEGDMEKKTEMREQFIPLDYQARPPLCKKFTNLHLEGEMDINTESNEQFVQYDCERRRPLIKRSTNLKLEGELEMKPEYRHEFVEYKSKKSLPSLPQHNLKIDGFFDSSTENKMNFVEHPPIPFLRGSDFNKRLLLGDEKLVKYPDYTDKFGQNSGLTRRDEQLQSEGEFQSLTESRRQFVEKPVPKQKGGSNLHVEGRIDMNPEYKNANMFKGGNVTSPGRRRRTHSQSGNLKSEGAMEMYPEYKRSYVDFPRQRPALRKPEGQLSSEGDMDHLTEKRAQYIEYPNYQRSDSLKRESEFKLDDGNYECQPEYRKAYIDYLIRERIDRKPRPLDNLGKNQTKRAFEILNSTDSQSQGDKKDTTDSSTAPKSDATPSSVPVSVTKPTAPKSLIPVSVKKLPMSSTTDSDTDKIMLSSSTLPRTKPKLTARRKSLSKLEAHLFGPKIEVPKIRSSSSSRLSSSRSPSPLPPKYSRSKIVSRYKYTGTTKSTSEDDKIHKDRTGSRFTSSIKVEDLAYTPCTSPIPTHKIYPSSPTRKKWNTDVKKSPSAFYVLEDDINNNRESYGSKMMTSLNKEQKWMPSWLSP